MTQKETAAKTASDALGSLVLQAAARARTNRRRVLVSVVERVPVTDPLAALRSAEHAAEYAATSVSAVAGTVASIMAIRMYWTRPADGFALAGLGAAVSFAPEGADRFAAIDREWAALIADALIDDPSGDAPGAGPALMGGFAFDPEGPRTDLWEDFPAARLILPRLQLAVTDDNCWLTTNLIVGTDGLRDVDSATLAQLRSAFLNDGEQTNSSTYTSTGLKRDSAVTALPRPSGESLTHEDVRDASDWRATVREAVRTIRSGKLEKVVLARELRVTAPRDIDVTAVLQQLRSAHPTCYAFGCWYGDSAFVGATPERLVRVDGHDVQASSLAGSVRRGATPADDAAQARQLLASVKDRAEHEIVRQALCTGLGLLCDDVTAADGPALLSLPNVHHLHTAVRARLRDPHTILQLVAQLHPTPAVGGAPRNAALRFIREHEQMDRGWYAAPIGWLQHNRGEFAVALRSALVTGAEASLFAGCGVVADSDPDQEYAESLLKLRPMESALAAAVTIEPATEPSSEPAASLVIDTADTEECSTGSAR